MKIHGDVDAMIHIYTAMALGRGNLCSAAFIPQGKLLDLFYRRLSEPQDKSGHGVKKNLYRPPSGTRGRPARSLAPCRLSYLSLESQ